MGIDKNCTTCANYTETCRKCVTSGTFSGWKPKEWSCETCGYVDVNDDNCGCWSPRDCVNGSEWAPKMSDIAALESESDSEPWILDSGERREFESGAVRDIQEGKGRCDLLPLMQVAELIASTTTPDVIISDLAQYQRTKNVVYLFDAIKAFSAKLGWSTETAMLEVSKHFEAGCQKYGERNWEKGIPEHCYIDSAVRHYLKWLDGMTDEPHDRAVLWNLICLWWTHENITEVDDERI